MSAIAICDQDGLSHLELTFVGAADFRLFGVHTADDDQYMCETLEG